MRKVKALGVAVATTLWRRVALTPRRRVAPKLRRRALHKVQILIANVIKLQHTYKAIFTLAPMTRKRVI